MQPEEVPVLVYEGDYSTALVLRSVLEAAGIEAGFEDVPVSGAGRSTSRIYVTRADEPEARAILAASQRSSDRRAE
jgi:hypothetical protein